MRSEQKDKLNALQLLVANHRAGRSAVGTSSFHFPAAVRASAVALISDGVSLRTVSKKAKLCPRLLTGWCCKSADQTSSKSLATGVATSPRVLDVVDSLHSMPTSEPRSKRKFRFGLGFVISSSFWQFGIFCSRTPL